MKEKTKRITIVLMKILLSYFVCSMAYVGYGLVSGERVSVSLQGEAFILVVTAILCFGEQLWKKTKER